MAEYLESFRNLTRTALVSLKFLLSSAQYGAMSLYIAVFDNLSA